MKVQDVQNEMQDGFEPSPLPPRGPDGAPKLEPIRPLPPMRPRLCEAGPCARYHRLEIQVDAANPRAQVVPIRLPVVVQGAEDAHVGTTYRAPSVFHTEVHHYCYPEAGIENLLGALPVTQCNRWAPLLMSTEGDVLGTRSPAKFWGSQEGNDYREAVASWERARAQEAQEADDAQQLIANMMAEHDQGEDRRACQGCGRLWRAHELNSESRCQHCYYKHFKATQGTP